MTSEYPTFTHDNITVHLGSRGSVSFTKGDHRLGHGTFKGLALTVPPDVPDTAALALQAALIRWVYCHNTSVHDRSTWDTVGVWSGTVTDDALAYRWECPLEDYGRGDRVFAFIHNTWRRALVVRVNRNTVTAFYRDMTNGTFGAVLCRPRGLRKPSDLDTTPLTSSSRVVARTDAHRMVAHLLKDNSVHIIEEGSLYAWQGTFEHGTLTLAGPRQSRTVSQRALDSFERHFIEFTEG